MSKRIPPPQVESQEEDPEQQAKLDKELGWCIGKIKEGIMSEKNSKKVEDALKLLKQLQSSATPLVKKRQLMHHYFGDYRAKIKQEEAKIAASKKDKIRVEFKKPEDDQLKNIGSKFLKKKSEAGKSSKGSEAAALADKVADLKISPAYDDSQDDQNNSVATKKKEITSLKLSLGSNDFKFDFAISD